MEKDEVDRLYKNWVELVQTCTLRPIIEELAKTDDTFKNILRMVPPHDDTFHVNRLLLFQFEKQESTTMFRTFCNALRRVGREELANKLEDRPLYYRSTHKTTCFEPAKEATKALDKLKLSSEPPLTISVTYSTKFCDEEKYNKTECYKTRSRNRGKVLIINNIHFEAGHDPRKGAEVDQQNLKVLFEKMGFVVDSYRDLSADDMKRRTIEFANRGFGDNPDICIFIIMSHGEEIQNQTVILGSDSKWVPETFFREQFNNQNCPLFRSRPKIMIFHVCRGKEVDQTKPHRRTESDSICRKKPDIQNGDQRLYSDMIICHPTVDGFKAHRDVIRGAWYMELVCKVFMENAHEMDVESMLKLVDGQMKKRVSEDRGMQTSTFQNIGFNTCYLHPGIYEEGDEIKQFKQSV